MTQTIRTANGRRAVWIEADHGQGRRTSLREVTWQKIDLKEYLELNLDGDLDESHVDRIRGDLLKFTKGYAWEAFDRGNSEIFATEEEARDWAWSRDC